MLSPSAILRLPYDASLTRAGIEYAKKSLHYTYNRMHLGTAARLRKIVAGVAVELAFQHWLDANRVPYDRLGMTAFTEKDKYDLRLGGRRCDLKGFLLGDRAKISALRRDPAWLLEAEALVPEDQFTGGALDEHDFYLFGFLAEQDLKSLAPEQERYLVYTPTQPQWRGAQAWRSLGKLALKSKTRRPLEMEIGGQNEKRAVIVERLPLEPRTRTQTQNEFFSLLYLHVPRLPEEAISVRSPVLRETRLVAPSRWINIWVYGIEIFIAGWLTKAEFRARSRKLPAGARVKQYPRTRTPNRAVRVKDLRPIAELAQLIKSSEWGRR